MGLVYANKEEARKVWDGKQTKGKLILTDQGRFRSSEPHKRG